MLRRAPRLAEGVRHHLLGVRSLANDGDRERVRRSPVAIVQLAQGPLIPGRHALHQRAIRASGRDVLLLARHHDPRFEEHAHRMAPNLDFAREFRNAVPDVLRRADEAGLTQTARRTEAR